MKKTNDVSKKNGHGGRREGAGRPKTVGSSRTISIRIPEEIAAILDQQENKTAFIIDAVRAYEKQRRKKTLLGLEISYTIED